MVKQTNPPRIPLPRGCPRRVKSAMLHVTSLAQVAMAHCLETQTHVTGNPTSASLNTPGVGPPPCETESKAVLRGLTPTSWETPLAR